MTKPQSKCKTGCGTTKRGSCPEPKRKIDLPCPTNLKTPKEVIFPKSQDIITIFSGYVSPWECPTSC